MAKIIENLRTRIGGNPVISGGNEYPSFNISEANVRTILAYDDEREVNKSAYQTRTHYMLALGKLAETVGDKRLLFGTETDLTREDIQRHMKRLMDEGTGEGALMYHRLCVKKFYRDKMEDGQQFPALVRWIKVGRPKSKLSYGDLPTPDEVMRLIRACESIRDKAIISLLCDGGMRRSELVSLRIRDITITGDEGEVRIPENGGPAKSSVSKTGSYTAFLSKSIPVLKRYMDGHPKRDDLDAALFYSMGRKEYGQPLESCAIYKILKRATKRAGITKRIYPHLLRHFHATKAMERGMSAEGINVMQGRKQGSAIAQTYLHLTSKTVKNEWLKSNGKEPLENPEDSMKPITCFRCDTLNTPDSHYCSKCGEDVHADKAAMRAKGSEVLAESAANQVAALLKANPALLKAVTEAMGGQSPQKPVKAL